jgi:hypothetical protein
MPDILVEVKGSWLDGKQAAFLEAAHQAVVQALGTPANEPLARLVEHPAANYLTLLRLASASRTWRSSFSPAALSKRSDGSTAQWWRTSARSGFPPRM